MKTAHTPGPWWNPPFSNEVMTIPRGDIKICKVHAISDNDHGEANAQLIAAAPELLEALKEALTRLKEIRDDHGTNSEITIKQSQQAITKATQP